MAAHSFTVRSSLPKDEAYPRLADLTKVPEWDDGIISSVRDLRDPTTFPTYSITTTGFDGQPMVATYRIIAAQACDHIVMIGENDVFRAVDSIVFFDDDRGGCTVHYHATLALVGDARPLTDEQLDAVFPKLVAAPERGLQTFLND